jgi:hypothetical protein
MVSGLKVEESSSTGDGQGQEYPMIQTSWRNSSRACRTSSGASVSSSVNLNFLMATTSSRHLPLYRSAKPPEPISSSAPQS